MKKNFTLLLSALFLFCGLIKAQSWSELGGLNGLSANNPINSVCSDASGNIYAAGWFTNSSGNWYVAKYNGSSWSELGGLNGLSANGYIQSVCSDASGNIYAAGLFTNSSGKMCVAKYGSATGINETSTAGIDVSVYPNPGTGELNIHSSNFKVDRIEIDNVLGKKIYEQTINSNHQTLN